MTPASIAMPVVNLPLPALRKSETTQPCDINRLVRRKSGRPTERSSPAHRINPGTEQGDKGVMQAAKADFPLLVEDHVYHCGFNSENPSAQEQILHPASGGQLADRFAVTIYLKSLVEAFDQMGRNRAHLSDP